jgi:hypothetical protein
MADPRLYEGNHYVVLETDQPECFLTKAELLDKIQTRLATIPPADLPQEIQPFATLAQGAEHLLETSCELDLGPDQFLQWYLVRLEKPSSPFTQPGPN